MKKTKKAMSIVLAIILTIIMGVIAIYLVDYIIPFSKNVKGIENVSRAYYQAQSGIEKSLYFVKDHFGIDNSKSFDTTNSVDYQYNIVALGNILPVSGKGNSEFDNNFNRLKVGEPIQLKIGNNRLSQSDWNNIKFTIRVPDLDNNGSFDENLTGNDNDFLVNWQLISPNGMLSANNTQITYEDIEAGTIKSGTELFDGSKQNSLGNFYYGGIKLDDTSDNFKNFYDNNCGAGNECILKMSVINDMKVDDGGNEIPVPYLEWKIDLTTTSKDIPLRYTQINSEGKSYGFKKDIYIRVPQQTVNEAFDFTVFQ